MDAATQSRYARTLATARTMTGAHDETARTLRRIAELVQNGLTDHASRPHGTGPVLPASAPRQAPEHRRVAQLAHELKTPLSAIVAAAEVMRDERLGPIGDDRYRGYASDIFDSATHALGVISVMLSSATLIAPNTSPLACVQLDLNETVARVTSSVRALVEAAGLTIDHELHPNLPLILADATSVRQMLLNLVTNAIRATPAGGRIDIATHLLRGGPVSVSVSDNGSGMTAIEIAAALNLPYANSNVPSELQIKPTGGLGLGYSIVRDLALANNATVSIESDPAFGTTVKVSFLNSIGLIAS
jgi:two-component system, cell cycle sensor histidine kinase PleC